MPYQLHLPDEAALTAWAGRLAGLVYSPFCLYLQGPLGSGKTTFARAFIHALGYPGRVKSPTYALLESYPLDDQFVHHLDLYRIADGQELDYLGLADLPSQAIWLIEWPEKGAGHLPPADWLLVFEDPGQGRDVRVFAESGLGRNPFDQLVRQ